MDRKYEIENIDDLSALAWVHDELRRSIESAHKSLRRFVRESEAVTQSDVDAVDPTILRGARAHLHQGVGALELVGLSAAAHLLRASESAVNRLTSRGQRLTSEACDAIERSSFGLLDYLGRMLAGKPVSPVALFPQYYAVQMLAGADRIHPADLWPHDWRWRDLPATSTPPRHLDEDTQSKLETDTLLLMRHPEDAAAAADLSDVYAGIANAVIADGADRRLASLWQLAAAFFEAQARGLLPNDLFTKRIASRLLAQVRMAQRATGDGAITDISDRLAQDILFYCAQAGTPPASVSAPRLAAARQAWGQASAEAVDYTSSKLGRFDPSVIAQAKKRVAAAKDSWSAVAADERHRLQGLGEQISLVGESIGRLFPAGDVLAASLAASVDQTVASQDAPPPSLAMEVATALLYVEAALDDSDFESVGQDERVRRLASRVDEVRKGNAPRPLEPWMEELYRRVADRQTMGSVVQELRTALGESERAIDLYFRDASKRDVLAPVPGQLQAMRGVVSVLGLDQASHTILRMRDDVEPLLTGTMDGDEATERGVFDRLAGNLGALGFMIDMLSVQPHMAKTLFRFDSASGLLQTVVRRGGRESGFGGLDGTPSGTEVEPRLVEQVEALALTAAHPEVPNESVARDLERLAHEALVNDQPLLAETMSSAQSALQDAATDDERRAVREELAHAMADFVASTSGVTTLQPELAPLPTAQVPLAVPTPTPVGETGLEGDDEMRGIFLEEARDVVDGARQAVDVLEGDPDNLTELTTVRRAFHTLKGSSRMVGLKEFGEGAWACEQLYNTRLADYPHADKDLRTFTIEALAYLSDWATAIEHRRIGGHASAPLREAADALRLHGRRVPLALPSTGSAVVRDGFVVPPQTGAPMLEAVSVPMVLTGLDSTIMAPDLSAVPAPTPITKPAPLSLNITDLAGGKRPGSSSKRPLDLDTVARAYGSTLQPDEESNFAATQPSEDAVAAAAEFEREMQARADEARRADESRRDEEERKARQAEEARRAEEQRLADEARQAEEDRRVRAEEARREAHAQEAERAKAAEEARRAEAAEAAEAAEVSRPLEAPVAEDFKRVGNLKVPLPLYNVYVGEAETQSRSLLDETAEWLSQPHRAASERAVSLAHSLAGNSATVGFGELSQLARSLEHALSRSRKRGSTAPGDAAFFHDAASEVRRLVQQFADGTLASPAAAYLPRLAKLADEVSVPTVRTVTATRTDDIDAIDSIDAELFVIFEEEGIDLLPKLSSHMRDWVKQPTEVSHANACLRALHTVKGGARLAGAMRLGEMAHRLESSIEELVARGAPTQEEVEALEMRVDSLQVTFDALRGHATAPAAVPPEPDSRAVRVAAPTAQPVQLQARPVQAPPAQAPLRPSEQPGAEVEPAASARDDVRVAASAEPAPAAVAPVPPRIALPRRDGDPIEAVDTMSAPLSALDRPSGPTIAMPRVDALAPPAPARQAAPAAADRSREAVEAKAATSSVAPVAPVPPAVSVPRPPVAPVIAARAGGARPVLPGQIAWSRFAASAPAAVGATSSQAAGAGAVRVKAALLDRLVNHAGEVSITRSRIDADVAQLKGAIIDLTDNLDRMRNQLREIELQAEMQISARLETAKTEGKSFDPLEMDRFTRFQELTRMLAESVNDVATVHRGLQRTVQSTEDQLATQARLTRELQDNLLRTRMVEFDSLSDRLYRVVRQAAKETGKQVRLDIVNGTIEVDRGVLERLVGSFEHLLRNCITHGIESPEARAAAGKPAVGVITISLHQEGNEVAIEVADDGAGLDFQRIRERGVALGLLAAGAEPSEADLGQLIFTPGFSTATKVTELAGRGVGMDVVRNEVNGLGGRVEPRSVAKQGATFKLVVPLTTAVTQVVMLRAGAMRVAMPSTLVEIVRRMNAEERDRCYATGRYAEGEDELPFYWLGALLEGGARSSDPADRSLPVVVVRSAQQRVAIHVDEVVGNQEVVVKNLGPQLSRLPGLAGVTLLPSGEVVLIYNPVALANLYGSRLREAASVVEPGRIQVELEEKLAPLVLVVDDSLTVRRVTQRMLQREGYRVALAKDGLDGLEKLAEEMPAVVLSDIEMPRMDGFDLVRNLRNDARWRELPVIMITSRIAEKHRQHAMSLGVNHYLGKPYSEEELLQLIARYAGAERQAGADSVLH
jgi:chemosensory pili system protein ChpA (sensor histidine kinase/response regulator)